MSTPDSPSVGTEHLRFSFDGGRLPSKHPFASFLVGVVGSGNLEVLVEAVPGTRCDIEVETSARGFEPIWQAVMRDFHARYPLAGVRLSIHDMGATPAVVSLRLQQAATPLSGGLR